MCGRVSCSMLSGLLGPIGLLRGGPLRAASDEDDDADEGEFLCKKLP